MHVVVDAGTDLGPSPVQNYLGANWMHADEPEDCPALVAARRMGMRRERIPDIFGSGDITVRRGASGLDIDFTCWGERLAKSVRHLGGPPLVLITYMPEALWREGLAELEPTMFGPAGQFHPPASWEEWEELIARLVSFNVASGYAGLGYEVWNEPDMPHFWAGTVSQYAELYVRAARQIKAADPSATVSGPGVSRYAQVVPGTKTPYILEFLKELKRLSAEFGEPVHLDLLSFHHYPNCWADQPGVRVAVEAIQMYLDVAGFHEPPRLSMTEWAREGGEQVSLQRMASYPVEVVAGEISHALQQGTPPDIADAYYYMLVGSDGNTELLVPDDRGEVTPTPAALSFEMLAAMADGQLLDCRAQAPVAAFAVRGQDAVRLVLTNTDEHQTHTAVLRISNLPWPAGSVLDVGRWTLDESVHWDHVHLATEPPHLLTDAGANIDSPVHYAETLTESGEVVLAQHLGPCAVLQVTLRLADTADSDR